MSDSNKHSWLEHWLPIEDRLAVEKSVETFEDKTHAEIVPMVVLSSSTFGHIPALLFFLFLSLFFLSGADQYFFFHFLKTGFVVVYGVLLSLFLAMVFYQFQWVRRLLVPTRDQDHQIRQRAENEFLKRGFNKTENRSAILLFVSVTEHRAAALGDTSINEKMNLSQWNRVVDLLTTGIKNKNMKQGFEKAISCCEEILKEEGPKTSSDTLSNKVIIEE